MLCQCKPVDIQERHTILISKNIFSSGILICLQDVLSNHGLCFPCCNEVQWASLAPHTGNEDHRHAVFEVPPQQSKTAMAGES